VNVFDASALPTFLQGDPGATHVQAALRGGGACGAANWSEVAQMILARGRNCDLSRSLLVSFGVKVEAVTVADAEWAARRWARGEGL
jgi:ribonuclease VapC